MRESTLQFGDHGRLQGILTEPANAPAHACLALVNAGFVPRFGPNRVYTQLARRLASEGITTLRFDLGGLGDSLPARAGLLRERTQVDIGLAIDALSARFPGTELMLGGLCSGAEDSFRYAAIDERVTRVVLVDPFAYRTRGWAWRHLLFRLQRRALRAMGRWTAASSAGAMDIIDYQYMPRNESEGILRIMLARRARLHFIYTAGRRETFNHPAQLQRMFPTLDLGPRTTVDFLQRIEHTQLLQEDREVLIGAIVRRLTADSAAPPAPRPR